MSMPMNRAPFLASDIVLLTMIFVSSSDAAGDTVSSLYTRQLPPIVSHPETLPGIPSASCPSPLPVDLIQMWKATIDGCGIRFDGAAEYILGDDDL
eukprot:9162888-Ditylum_brightwellii.AAC.1